MTTRSIVPPTPDVPAAPRQPLEAELEAEEEEEEDQPELGDEVRHLGRLDQAERGRLVRAEQEAGEQVGRDRGEPDAARDEARARRGWRR